METGQRLLHYRLGEKLGEGGMGVVWRATDTSLDRDVAIKLLPQQVSQEAERLARFEREAKLLASLNHPNIATIHGLHASEGLHFLAMELVEGEDLSSRLARGALPLDDALAICRQIAAALEAAHAQGVVHRDLKPANVMLTADGVAKVLDFGLAKAVQPDAASMSGSLSVSPTITSLGTVAGVILGTAAYMSPEQARGKPVDRRADLWSFGCVLYECLTGVQLFGGETVSDSLAAILRKEPDWSTLPERTPPLVRLLLRRCLTREPSRRMQDAGDARLELEQSIEDPEGASLGLQAAAKPSATPTRRGRIGRWLPWCVAAIAVIVAIAAGAGRDVPEPATRRLAIPVEGATSFGDAAGSPPAISPDGRHLVFGVQDGSGDRRLLLRGLDSFEARPLPETEGAMHAFWSADGRHVGFFRAGRLRRLELETGRAQAIGGEGSSFSRGASWNDEGQIVFSPNSNSPILLIDAGGGEPRAVTTLEAGVPDVSHRWPSFLPDGKRFIYLLWTNDLEARAAHGGVYLASLDGGPSKKLVADASNARYVEPGYLLLARGDNVVALPCDPGTLEVDGEAILLGDDVMRDTATGHAAFTVSDDGVLVYASGDVQLPTRLSWYDRSGNVEQIPLDPAVHLDVDVAPDGSRAALIIPGENGDGELWVADLERGVRTRLAWGDPNYSYAAWSGDGSRVMYGVQQTGGIEFYTIAADGSGQPQPALASDADKELFDWSDDGRYIAYWPFGPGSGTPDIWVHSVERGVSEPFLEGAPGYRDAQFSPDNRWIVFSNDESGQSEIFVQAFIDDGRISSGARWQLSTAGGSNPSWRNDGREIVFRDRESRLISVSVEADGERLKIGVPTELFRVEATLDTGAATGDHRRFLLATRDTKLTEPLRVVIDW